MPEWKGLTNDHTILQYFKGIEIEFINYQPPPANNFVVIVVSQQEPEEFISPILFLPKKDGLHRMILNLKKFNEYVQYHHFKMDTLEVTIKLMKPGCYMASVDLKDAYHTVSIHPEHPSI